MSAKKEIIIYSDGACAGNPGPGGYGAILVFGKNEKKIAAGFRKTTNNRMEIMAVIEALKSLKFSCRAVIYSDSKYVVDAMTKHWPHKWRQKNWHTSGKQLAKNVDLWKEMLELEQQHELVFNWVKGHSGNHYNEIADELAVGARDDKANYKVDEPYEKDA
ncbi:MAG: ribonuclease HI [Planctomycetes bacterium]|nr:ribonuclease HI [Planctomycetota bacterium]